MMKSSALQVDGAPRYPFVNHSFVVTVQLRRGARLVCNEETPILVKLFIFEEDRIVRCNDPILDYDPQTLIVGKDGFATFPLTLTAPSSYYGNNDFCLEFSVKSTDDHSVPPVFTDRMYAVTRRIIIDKSLPDVFHNQRGGKNSCIEIYVSLRDHANDIVRGQTIPVKAVLLYDKSYREVVDQSILVSLDSRMVIGPSGESVLKFRIEEVSRNHQKQLFVIRVVPDTIAFPRNSDIGPDSTTPIYVKSRPTRKKAHLKNQSGGGAESAATAGMHDSSDDEVTLEHKIKMARTGAHPGLFGPLPTSPRSPRPELSSSFLDQASTHKVFADVISEYHAAMQEMAQLQWVQIGVEEEEGGATRPLFRMKNPNAKIVSMLERYHDVTESLKQELDEMAARSVPPVPPLASLSSLPSSSSQLPSTSSFVPGNVPISVGGGNLSSSSSSSLAGNGGGGGSGNNGFDSLCAAVLAVSAAQDKTESPPAEHLLLLDRRMSDQQHAGAVKEEYGSRVFDPPSTTASAANTPSSSSMYKSDHHQPPPLLSSTPLTAGVEQSGVEQFSIFLHSLSGIKGPPPTSRTSA